MSQINGQEFDDYLVDSVSIDEADIQAEYCRVAADLAYWGHRHAEAERAHHLAKAELKQVEAKSYLQAREILTQQEGKVTEKKVEAKAQLMPELAEAHARLADCIQARKELVAVVEAVATKRDMLISLGATQRKEMEGEPALRE